MQGKQQSGKNTTVTSYQQEEEEEEEEEEEQQQQRQQQRQQITNTAVTAYQQQQSREPRKNMSDSGLKDDLLSVHVDDEEDEDDASTDISQNRRSSGAASTSSKLKSPPKKQQQQQRESIRSGLSHSGESPLTAAVTISTQRNSTRSIFSHRSQRPSQRRLSGLDERTPSDDAFLPTNIPGIEAEATAAEPKPLSLAHRLLHTHGADVGAMERDADEEPEGRQYARAGRPFLMMRPAHAAIADFSNALPDDEKVQFVKYEGDHDGESSDESSVESDSEKGRLSPPVGPIAAAPAVDPSVTERVQKETSRVLSALHKNSKRKKKKRKGRLMCGMCGIIYVYRYLLFVMFLSFAAAGGVLAWNVGQRTVTDGVPAWVLVAIPGLLCVLYLLCTLAEFAMLGLATRLLASTPWNVRNIIKVLRFHFRIITIFIIADVTTSIWLADYKATLGAFYLRGIFRSVYAVSICIVLKRLVLDSSIHSMARSHYALRVKQTIRAEDYLEMIASTGCSAAIRQKLKDRRRMGSSWRSYGYTERARRLTMQALMLPYVRTQDDVSEEVAYFFSTDMIIEVNTVRGMRVLAYVLFDTLVQHVQYLQGASASSPSASASPSNTPTSASGTAATAGGAGATGAANTTPTNTSGGNASPGNRSRGSRAGAGADESAVAADSLTFSQWNSCFDDRGQAQRARKMIFTPHQLSSWRENKNNRVIRRQDFVQACVGLFIKRQLLSSQVTNFNKLSTVISALISRLLVVLLVFVLAACFEVDIRELLVSASAVLLSVSFALGSSISRAVESIIFVFGTYAYSIGDRVVIGPDPKAKAAFVQSVDLLTTTFRHTTGEVFIMSNADLARDRIYNMRRTTNAVVVLSFILAFDTTWSAIDQLKNFIMQYLEKHKNSWKPGADLYVDSLQRTESMAIDIWFESVHSWQVGAVVGLAKTKLLRQVRLKMVELGIKWQPTPQTLRVQMTQENETVSGAQGEAAAAGAGRRLPTRARADA